jgi:transcription elongation factor Elf1
VLDLSHAVDVYHAWIDACEEVNVGQSSRHDETEAPIRSQPSQPTNRDKHRIEDEDDEDDLPSFNQIRGESPLSARSIGSDV